jgi:hypothetical protein
MVATEVLYKHCNYFLHRWFTGFYCLQLCSMWIILASAHLSKGAESIYVVGLPQDGFFYLQWQGSENNSQQRRLTAYCGLRTTAVVGGW